jgi:hypothetical protein
MREASARGFTAAAARELIERRADDQEWEADLIELTDKALSIDPADPCFRFFKIELELGVSLSEEEESSELERIQEEAARRGDEGTRHRVHHRLQELRAPSPLDVSEDEEVEDEEVDLKDLFEDDEEADADDVTDLDYSPNSRELLDSLPPEVVDSTSQLLSILSQMSEAQIEEARRTRPKDMPRGDNAMNPYLVLGVLPDADDQAIRRAYLENLKEAPPETNPGRFKAISAAYDKIKDEGSRHRYTLFDEESPADSPLEAFLRYTETAPRPSPPSYENLMEFLRVCLKK